MQNYIAKTLKGFEELLSEELKSLGAQQVLPLKRAVRFQADLKTMYRIHIESRLSIRLLKPLFLCTAKNETQLYAEIQKFDWSSILDNDQTFAISTTVHSQYFNHSKYVALKTKDAIVDQFRDKTGERPSIDRITPDVGLHVHVSNHKVDVLIDATGQALHKRGYRSEQHKAPLNEILAAGMVLLSKWDTTTPLIDPMCGSATLLIEAAMIAKNIAPNLKRSFFAFMLWPSFDKALLDTVKLEAEQKINDLKLNITGHDHAYSALRAAEENIDKAGLKEHIVIEKKQVAQLSKTADSGTLIINPPYGERLYRGNINEMYQSIGSVLKHQFSGWQAWIISSNKEALNHIGLKASKKIALNNGGIECKYQQYQMYSGSKKLSKNKS